MSKPNDFSEASYARHELHFEDFAEGSEKSEEAKRWLRTDTVNAWRHERMYSSLDSFINLYKDASWLTVGDGRYGMDAQYILRKGGRALATDIADTLLAEAKQRGMIPDFRRENAERLSFSDGEFDFSLCKESYHHFPKPYLALYEMLRVTSKAVVLIEPADDMVSASLFTKFFRGVKQWIKRGSGRTGDHLYETSGNYIYRISKREMEKVALGLNFPAVGFLDLNDAYIPGSEDELLASDGPIFKKMRFLLAIGDLLSKWGVMTPTLLVTAIFKELPSEDLSHALESQGWQIRVLSRNPYI